MLWGEQAKAVLQSALHTLESPLAIFSHKKRKRVAKVDEVNGLPTSKKVAMRSKQNQTQSNMLQRIQDRKEAPSQAEKDRKAPDEDGSFSWRSFPPPSSMRCPAGNARETFLHRINSVASKKADKVNNQGAPPFSKESGERHVVSGLVSRRLLKQKMDSRQEDQTRSDEMNFATPTERNVPSTHELLLNRSQEDTLVEDTFMARMEARLSSRLGPKACQNHEKEKNAVSQHERAKFFYLQTRKLMTDALHRANSVVSKANSTESFESDIRKLEEELKLARIRREGTEVPVRISSADRQKYQEAIRQPQDKVLVSHNRSNIDVKGRDLGTLAPGKWLNDEIINVVMSLLQERDMRMRSKGDLKKCHFFNSFFMSKLYKDSGRYDYNAVRRWTAPSRLKMCGQVSTTVLKCDRIIVPVNQGNLHWVCAVADLENRKFVFYDPLGGKDFQCLENLARYVCDEFQNKLKEQRDDVLQWPREFPDNIPQQENGYDCGVFAMLFAEYASRAAMFDFSQDSIPLFRIKIACDILQSKIE